MALHLVVNPEYPQPRQVRRIVSELLTGAVIVYPTDTIYGLGCDIFNKKTIERIYQIKQESLKKPLSFVCADLTDLAQYAKNISNTSYRLMKRLLPGPYTFILEASRLVPKVMVSKRKTVGIRVPENEICLAIVRELGHPIVSTSVTRDEDEILNNPADIEARFGKVVDVIVDGGILVSEPSTVVDLTGEEPVVIRKGKGDTALFE
ncbi:MAG: threonylcarbamoyl-AMP synthase [Candidatus Latescibacteria bacterium]|nr:threonylcarbamoyl-AMP synthase [Candidatus Latescibacterota bacterium]